MQPSFKRIVIGSTCFLMIFAIAITGYMLAGWNLLDAIYMVVITVFGVGFGEVGPMSPPLRIFTIFVIVSGYTAVGYIVGNFIQMITEGEINRALGARRMTRDIQTLKNHVIICGYGRIGQILAKRMTEASLPCVIVDNSLERIETARGMGYLVCHGNATDEEVLATVRIDRAKVLTSVLPDDSLNVYITLTARSLNPNLLIVARGEFPSTEKKLRQAGADHVVLPAEIGAVRMSHLITHPAALNFLEEAETEGGNTLNELLAKMDIQLDEFEIRPDSAFVGQSISTVEVRGKGTFLVVGIQRADGTIVIHPKPEEVLHAGDTLIVMGHRGDIPTFAARYALKRQMRYHGPRHY